MYTPMFPELCRTEYGACKRTMKPNWKKPLMYCKTCQDDFCRRVAAKIKKVKAEKAYVPITDDGWRSVEILFPQEKCAEETVKLDYMQIGQMAWEYVYATRAKR